MPAPTQVPEIIAHRGASRERPENTLAAFRRAMELGADAVELDVHVTSDGVPVVHHDPAIAVAAGGTLEIHRMRADAVRRAMVDGEPVPTLREVLALLDGKLLAYCELKGRGSCEATIAVLAERRARAAVHAFDHREVRTARALSPDIPRGVLEASYPLDALHAARSVAARDLWRHRDHVDKELIDTAHAAGIRVIAWTVNDAASLSRLAAWGIDGLCTDDVALARSALGR